TTTASSSSSSVKPRQHPLAALLGVSGSMGQIGQITLAPAMGPDRPYRHDSGRPGAILSDPIAAREPDAPLAGRTAHEARTGRSRGRGSEWRIPRHSGAPRAARAPVGSSRGARLRLHQEPAPGAWDLLGARVHNIGRGATRLRAIRAILAEHRCAPFCLLQAFFSGACGLVAVSAAHLLGIPSAVHVAGGEPVRLPDIRYG